MVHTKHSIEIDDLTISYGHTPVLWDIELDVPTGAMMGIIGPNGAGKSTLLKAILNIVKPLTGRIQILGGSYQQNKKKIGYVPQRQSVDWNFPITVFDVVLMGTYGKLGWIKRPRKYEKGLVYEALEKLKIDHLANNPIENLSGGQQQRTFLARVLVQEPEIFLLDEPFTGVDIVTEKIIVENLKELQGKNKTILAVHHDLQTASVYFDSLTLLHKSVIATGTTSSVLNKENLKQTYGENFLFSSF